MVKIKGIGFGSDLDVNTVLHIVRYVTFNPLAPASGSRQYNVLF